MTESAPRDAVHGPGITRALLDMFEHAANNYIEVHEPGEFIEDVDGLPLAVGPATTSRMFCKGLTISRAEADQLGVTDTDYKHIKIL